MAVARELQQIRAENDALVGRIGPNASSPNSDSTPHCKSLNSFHLMSEFINGR